MGGWRGGRTAVGVKRVVRGAAKMWTTLRVVHGKGDGVRGAWQGQPMVDGRILHGCHTSRQGGVGRAVAQALRKGNRRQIMELRARAGGGA